MRDADELPLSKKLAYSTAAFALLLLLLGAVAALGEGTMRSIAPRTDEQKLGVRLESSPRKYGLLANARAVQTGVVLGDSYTLWGSASSLRRPTPSALKSA